MFRRKKKPEMYIPPELQAYYQPEVKAQKRSNKRRVIFAIAALTAVIALGIGIGLLVSSHRSDPFVNTDVQNGQPTSVEAPKPKSEAPAPANPGVTDSAVEQP